MRRIAGTPTNFKAITPGVLAYHTLLFAGAVYFMLSFAVPDILQDLGVPVLLEGAANMGPFIGICLLSMANAWRIKQQKAM